MEKKNEDVGSAICNTLSEVRRVLDMLPVTGKTYCAAILNADNALLYIINEIQSGRITVSPARKDEKGDDTD